MFAYPTLLILALKRIAFRAPTNFVQCHFESKRILNGDFNSAVAGNILGPPVTFLAEVVRGGRTSGSDVLDLIPRKVFPTVHASVLGD
jgi:hypothetical protein